MRQLARLVAASAACGLLLTLMPAAALAAPAGWARFTGTSDGAPFPDTLQQEPEGFPTASIRTDSAGGTGTGVLVSGSSSTLTGATPPGTRYGTSSGQQYLGLRPRTASQTSSPPSVTTFTFERPTPATGWTFVLGDVDADQVTITGTDADGDDLTVTDLGFQGTFNYRGQADEPTWDPDTATLIGSGSNTNGASGWFEPTAPVATLTLTFDRLVGSPTYQVWFSSLEYDLSGTVTAPDDADLTGTAVELLDADGVPLASTEVDDDGAYAFVGYATYDDYQVRVIPPPGLRVVDNDTRTVDLSEADQVDVDFELEVAPTGTASGAVTDAADDPVADATVTVNGPEGVNEVVTTDDDGTWQVPDLPPADYTATLTPPTGLEADGREEIAFTVDEDGADVTGLDFSVVEITRDVTGSLTDSDGRPLAGVDIDIDGPGAFSETVTTDDDGEWTVEDLSIGAYEALVRLPEDLRLAGENPRSFAVEADGTVSGNLAFTAAAVPEPTPTPTPTPTPEPSATTEPPSTPTPTDGLPSGVDTSGPTGCDQGAGGTPGGRLAATGGPATAPTAAGLALVLAGIAVLIRPRPHRSSRPHGSHGRG